MNVIYPVILSGGSGTRLWPLSRAMYPKQFISVFNDHGSSLLATTLQRLASTDGFAQPTIVCNNDHRFLVKEDAERAGVKPRAVVLEPVARNTAPAAAVAALLIEREDPAGILVVMPSDHVVKDEAGFVAAVRQAAEVAATGKLVLLGVKPGGPHIGYGYIRRGPPLPGFPAAHVVEAFTEKPDKAAAASYVRAGTYFWNSGIFIFRARAYLDELARLQPSILEAATQALAGAKEDLGFLRLEAQAFAKAPSISIDYAVMERTSAAAVVPVDIGWSDVGSWSSLWEISAHDAAGNAVARRGGPGGHEQLLRSCRGGRGRHHRRQGPRDRRYARCAAGGRPRAGPGRVRHRRAPEGAGSQRARATPAQPSAVGVLRDPQLGPRFQVKLLHVKPGAKLSMQMHHHRSEHWVVVHGTARVTIDGAERLVRENESVYITATQWHRLENPGKTPLELIEVQIGSYLAEDDIIRSADAYNRAPDETR